MLTSIAGIYYFLQATYPNLIYRVHIASTINTKAMSISTSLARIEHYLNLAKVDDEKLAAGTKSAAPKVRSSLLEIGKLVSESRKLALDVGKQIPTKKRVPKVESKSDEEMPESPALERQDAVAEVKAVEVSDTPTIKKRGRKPKLAPAAA